MKTLLSWGCSFALITEIIEARKISFLKNMILLRGKLERNKFHKISETLSKISKKKKIQNKKRLHFPARNPGAFFRSVFIFTGKWRNIWFLWTQMNCFECKFYCIIGIKFTLMKAWTFEYPLYLSTCQLFCTVFTFMAFDKYLKQHE